jgi:hypothetical protein
LHLQGADRAEKTLGAALAAEESGPKGTHKKASVR